MSGVGGLDEARWRSWPDPIGHGQRDRKDTSPAFSPNGKEITLSSNRDGNFEIYKMLTDGTGPVNLTDDPAGDFTPDWQPLKKRH